MSTSSNIYHSLAIGLAIKTIFGAVLGGFNDGFNVLNNEFELEKSGLSDTLSSPTQTPDTQTADPTAPPIDRNGTICLTGAGSREFDDLGHVCGVVLTTSVIFNL